ncbi:type IV pilus modification protein PilV [Novilysobacter spongiicola]|uniref:Type IV pilus assembly protein PilV n=1 Tax=Lysobacter spongiicola DSM 21749 TaxID=1122188 RepID=A0A1T4P1S3_9GAMM|nr:type IV pilus modification protein PilV [Lysobacter spongiicola]SJZ85560.1 type IV pilus assembly protein PilV [Lysobacter spongiicola DSM 21749]
MITPRCAAALQKGVGLVEVMIAVLVFAVGLLGIAALQATALKNSQSSLERSQAVIHTYGILDSMRANLVAARAGQYDTGGMQCAAGDPDAGTLAQRDVARWLTSMQTGGMGADACGQIQCVLATQYCTITVRWNDVRGLEGEAQQEFSTETRI